MTRKGVVFEYGWPSFDFGSVYYCWPNNPEERQEDFLNKRGELVNLLDEKFREYSLGFGCGQTPREAVILGERGITVSWMDSGRWIEFWKMLGGYFVAGHNLDSWMDNAAAFNLASDVLEYLSPEILAPRIYKKDRWELKYPLPEGKSPTDNTQFSEEILKNLYSAVEWGVPEIRKFPEGVIIHVPEGDLIIDKSYLKTDGFSNRDIPKSSFVSSRLMSLTDPHF